MAPRELDQKLNEVAEKLTKWVEKRNLPQDAYITGLLRALEEKSGLGYWNNLDPFMMLPKPSSSSARKLMRISRFVAITRNALIFTPVALTWYAIGKATTAFQEYIAVGGSSTVNFLEFWQNGYGILEEKWRIGNVAFLDFLIILVIIIMSLITGSIQIRALEVDFRENEIIDAERFDLALEISRQLHFFSNPTTPQINSQIVNSIRALERSTQELNRVTAELKKSLPLGEKLKKSTTTLEKSNRKTVEASTSLIKQVKILQKLSSKQGKGK